MNLIHFKVSAPGKLSLFGEHAVKYGKSGIAAGIDLRTTLTFAELPDLCPEGVIRLEFPQIDLFLRISVRQFLVFYRHCEKNIRLLHDRLQNFVASNSHLYSTENQKAIVRAFFFLLVSVTYKEAININSIHLELSTKLMMDSDFVCLTPSTVCFATCFLHWSYLQKDIHSAFDDSDLKKICLYAAECEKIFSNFGIFYNLVGPTVCTYGSIVEYIIVDDYASVNRYTNNIPNEMILLVDSKQTPNLEIQTQRLVDLTSIHPAAASSIFSSMEFATNMASNAFQKLGIIYESNDTDTDKRLSILLENNTLMTSIDMSQRLLQLLNVSHYHLDEICAIAQRHGLHGKYTDIGAGRYAYIWCQPQVSERRVRFLSQELKANHFDVTCTSLASSGVKIE